MSRQRRISKAALVLIGLVGLVLPLRAVADHGHVEQISIGGNGAFSAAWAGASDDGGRVFFDTKEQLVGADTDTSLDVYERYSGVTTLISTGPSGGNGAFDAFYAGASSDGARVFFHTKEKLVSGDTDSSFDVYQRSGATTSLLSTGPTGGNGTSDAFFRGASRDGTRVFFETTEKLTSSDTDSVTDVYEASGGSTSLVSTGPTSAAGTHYAFYSGSSSDGTHVFFETDDRLVTGDTDLSTDVYDRSSGATTRVSTGPAGGNAASPAGFDGSSSDGSHVFFHTSESLTSSDSDAFRDIYDRSGGTTTQISTGTSGGNGAFDAGFDGSSSDGTRVFFETQEKLVGGDTDAQIDLYQRSGGSTSLLSTGPSGGNGAFDAFIGGSSTDGTNVYFTTQEKLVSADTDSSFDVYGRSGSTTTLVSTGPSGGNGAFDAFFDAAFNDTVYFETKEALVSADTDSSFDVYESHPGLTTLLTTGPNGGNGTLDASFAGSTPSGSRIFFETSEALLATDTDGSQDVYAAVFEYPRPAGASPTRIPFVPAFIPCGAPGSSSQNASHNSPKSGTSCSPPVPSSSLVAVGSSSLGFVRFIVLAMGQCAVFDSTHCYPDFTIRFNVTDVRSGSPSGPDYNPAGSTDLTGTATLPGGSTGSTFRVTDKYNRYNSQPSSTFDRAATSGPLAFPVPISCTITSDPAVGSTCSAQTTANTLFPGAAVAPKRAIWELGQLQLLDNGANGVPGGGDDKVFEVQGFFAP